MKVLIADDDPAIIALVRAVLEEAGYEVMATTNALEAVDILKRGRIELAICDWEMPDVDGLELCRMARAGAFGVYVYMILLTAHAGSDAIVEGMNAGADDFISKPFNPAELLCRLRAGERVLALQSRDLTIFALAKLAESRDPETGAHLERVRGYSRLLAETLGEASDFAERIDTEFTELIFQTSPLHDIGKVAIPDSVLLKPGRLSEREYEVMKTHAAIGAETLDAAIRSYDSARFLTMARDIALSHHERYDGSGYPNRLAGEDIPLAGRIVALADVYDALMSNRVYKKAYGHDVTRGIILDDRGTHFDPNVTDAFERVEAKFLRIREQFDDERMAAA